MNLQRGDLVGDRYEVQKLLGRGGSAAVYLVTDLHIRRERALKLISKSAAEEGCLNLYREIELLGMLKHPRLPELVDVIDGESELAIVMDFIAGRSLSDVLKSEGARDEREVVGWGIQLAELLQYLHSLSPPVIYRDMKPGNIMLRPDGEISLLDFGIASQMHGAVLNEDIQLGTMGYAAPEQLGGGQVDARTDLYALGATLYHLLTGEKPWECKGPLPPLREKRPSLRREWTRIICTCTKENPDERYKSAEELLQHLRRLEKRIRIGRAERPGRERGETGRKENRRIMAIGVAVFGGIAGIMLTLAGRASAREELGRNYQRILLEADAIVQTSFSEERYISEATQKYAQAADLIPSREDAYLLLLDYCARMGRTGAGLSAVCSRIDSGSGGIDRSASVLFRVAELFFLGNPLDESFHVDYRRAARYFAMIDRLQRPEAVYFASIAEALSTSSKKKDWRRISQMLAAFEEYNGQVADFGKRIRNRILSAGVYTANRHAFLKAGINAYEAPIRLLEEAFADLEESRKEVEAGVITMPPAEDLLALRQQILRNLAAAHTAAAVGGEESGSLTAALTCCRQLLALTEDEEEKAKLREQMENVERVSEYLREEEHE